MALVRLLIVAVSLTIAVLPLSGATQPDPYARLLSVHEDSRRPGHA
jgi:hypothetical protein